MCDRILCASWRYLSVIIALIMQIARFMDIGIYAKDVGRMPFSASMGRCACARDILFLSDSSWIALMNYLSCVQCSDFIPIVMVLALCLVFVLARALVALMIPPHVLARLSGSFLIDLQ